MPRTPVPPSHHPASVAVAAALAAVVALPSCAQAPISVPPPPASGKAAKRAGPDDVAPVRLGDTRYEVVHWGLARGLAHNGGYIRAVDAATGRELWVLEVYRVEYEPKRERDVQDVFIETLRAGASGRTLEVIDEDGRHYEIDPAARSVRAL